MNVTRVGGIMLLGEEANRLIPARRGTFETTMRERMYKVWVESLLGRRRAASCARVHKSTNNADFLFAMMQIIRMMFEKIIRHKVWRSEDAG